MTTIGQQEPRFSAEQIEAAILALPLKYFVAALHFGVSEESGCTIARSQMADDVRRRLLAGTPPTGSAGNF
jgi:hypothetical protein